LHFRVGSFYRVCGNVQGVCKRPGHATGEKAVVGYYEPVKARKSIDGRLNTFLSMEEFAGKEQERIDVKRKEMTMASSRFSPLKDSPTGSEEELYFQARLADTRLLAHQPRDHVKTAETSKEMLEPKKEKKPTLKTPPKYSQDGKFADKLGSLDTKFPFKSEAGIGDSPTFKTLKAAGLKVDSMNPATVLMMSMVDQLTTSMAPLASKVEEISSEPAKTAPATQPPQKHKELHSEPAKAAKEVNTKSKYLYGVGHGLDGAFGVYASWGEAAPLVVGVSKAIFQRFDNRQDAQAFVDATQALRQQQAATQPSETPVSDVWYAVTNSKTGHYNIFPSWPAA
jgi:hypothetical protein